MRPFRIMLADPPFGGRRYVYYQPTLGILYLIGALRQAFGPKEVSIRYLQGFGDLRDHHAQIRDFAPDIYGLSFKTPMAALAYSTVRATKKAFPRLPLIAGGAHASIMAHDILQHTPAEACLRGECETSMVELVNAFANGKADYDRVRGAVFRRGDALVQNPVPEFASNLDRLAWPAWDLIEPGKFPGMPVRKAQPYLGVVVSRGCPFQCIFCSEPVWKIFGRPTYRARSPACIVEEVEYLYSLGARELRLWCEELNNSSAWAAELLRRIAALHHHDLFLNCNIRADNLTPELVDAMEAANLWLVTIGMESAADRTLEGLHKCVTTAQIEESCRILSARGIRIAGYFQFFSAWQEQDRLAHEGVAEAHRTLQWIFRMWRRGWLHYVFTSQATPRPGTLLWDIAQRFGLLKKSQDSEFTYTAQGMRLPGVTETARRWVELKANVLKALIALSSGGVPYTTIVSAMSKLCHLARYE